MYRRRFIKRREGFCTDFAPLPPRTSPPTELIIGFLVFSDPRFFFVLDRGRESFDRGPRLTRPIWLKNFEVMYTYMRYRLIIDNTDRAYKKALFGLIGFNLGQVEDFLFRIRGVG